MAWHLSLFILRISSWPFMWHFIVVNHCPGGNTHHCLTLVKIQFSGVSCDVKEHSDQWGFLFNPVKLRPSLPIVLTHWQIDCCDAAPLGIYNVWEKTYFFIRAVGAVNAVVVLLTSLVVNAGYCCNRQLHGRTWLSNLTVGFSVLTENLDIRELYLEQVQWQKGSVFNIMCFWCPSKTTLA